MTIVVRAFSINSLSKAACTVFSLSESRAEVASSRRRIFGSLINRFQRGERVLRGCTEGVRG
jgi:hypothetical protein